MSYAISKGSKEFGLMLYKSVYLDLMRYMDADWTWCLDDRRSMSGYYVMIGENVISGNSSKQKVVSRSSTKFEYRVLEACVV